MAAERTLIRRSTWAERVQPLTRNPGRTAALALVGLLLVAIGVRIWLSSEIVTPWIMVDEFLYSEMAKSFAASGQFLVRDAPTGINNVVYPALISPAWLAHPMGTTYALAKAINVVVMTATAIPLFLWARKLVAPVFALVAVALTLLMPAFVYTGMLMTENAFLPAFVLAAFAIALALERPTLFRQLAAFASILLSVAIRFQGLVFLAVLPLAILLKVLFELLAERRPQPWQFVWRELRRYWISFALLAGGAVLYIGLQAARGHTLSGGLGGYQVVTGHQYSFGQVRHWVLLHFAEFFFSVGMLPASALPASGRSRIPAWRDAKRRRACLPRRGGCDRAAPRHRGGGLRLAFLFAGRGPLHVLPRAAPLPGVCPVARSRRPAPACAHDRRRSRSRRPAVRTSPRNPAERLDPLRHVRAHPAVACCEQGLRRDTGGASLNARRRGGGGALLRALAVQSIPTRRVSFGRRRVSRSFLSSWSSPRSTPTRVNLKATAGSLGSASWIDERIGSGGNASFLLGTTNDPWPETLGLWQNEFWNRSLGAVYNLGAPEPAVPETPVQLSPTTGIISSKTTGRAIRSRYVVTSMNYGIDGRLIGARPPFALYVTDGPLRVAEARSGIYGDGWAGADAAYSRFATTTGGRLAVSLSRRLWTGHGCAGARRRSAHPVERSRRRQGAREAHHHASQRADKDVDAEGPEPAVHRDRPHLADVLPIAVRPT